MHTEFKGKPLLYRIFGVEITNWKDNINVGYRLLGSEVDETGSGLFPMAAFDRSGCCYVCYALRMLHKVAVVLPVSILLVVIRNDTLYSILLVNTVVTDKWNVKLYNYLSSSNCRKAINLEWKGVNIFS
jgi:hypothetical protein